MEPGVASSDFFDTEYSAFPILHQSSYHPQPATDATGILENILHPPSDSTNLLPGRRDVRHQNANPQSKKALRRAPRTRLSALIADEEQVAQRKQNIGRFGSTWIRPPGISKTKQAMDDEEAEMKEQELAMQREAALTAEREAQEQAERAPLDGVGMDAAMDGDFELAESQVNVERNLDDEVPEAEAMASDEDYDVDEEGEDEEAEDAQGMEEEEQDLDDDVPEAGSYEHTDTELESSETEDSRLSGPLRPVTLAPPQGPPSLDGHRSPTMSSRFSGTPGSLGLDSSILSNSPGAARGHRRGQSRPER